MKKQPECEWFVEPLDDDTNRIIFKHLAETGAGGEEDIIIHLSDSKGKFHNVLKVPDHWFIAHLQRSQQNLDLHLLVFNRRGEAEKIRIWPFNAKKRLPLEVQKRIAKAKQTGLDMQ